MKVSRIIGSAIIFILFIELINSQRFSKNINGKISSSLETELKDISINSNIDNKNKSYKFRSLQNDVLTELPNLLDLEKLFKPSKAFTAILMVYMVLIIAGAILTLIIIKPKIES